MILRCRPPFYGLQSRCGPRWLPPHAAAVPLLLCWLALAVDAEAQQPTVTLDVSPATVMESAGGADINVTASLSIARGASTTVTLSLEGDARPGGPGVGDYTVAPQTPVITIPVGHTEGSVNLVVSPVDDTYWEQDEEVVVAGDAPGLEVTGAAFVIEDDEYQPELQLAFNDGLLQVRPGGSETDTLVLRLTGDATFEDPETVTITACPTRSDLYTSSPSFPLMVTLPAGATNVESAPVTFTAASVVPRLTSCRVRAEFDDFPSIAARVGFIIHSSQRLISITQATFDPGAIRAGAGAVSVTLTMRISPAQAEDLDVEVSSTSSDVPTFALSFPAGTTRATATSIVHARSAAGSAYYSRPANTDEYLFSGVVDSLYFYSDRLFVRTVQSNQASGQGHDFLLEGDSFNVSIRLNQPVRSAIPPTLVLTLDSGRTSEFPCHFQGRSLECRYRVKRGDRDEDKLVGLDRGALNFGGQSLRSPYDADIVYTTPVVPAAPVQIRIPRRVLGGTDEIHLLLSLESLQEGVGPTDVVVTATRSGTIGSETAPRDIAVPLVVVDGTTSPGDYSVSGTQTITIRRGQVSGTTTLTVTAVDDYAKETRVEEVRIEGGTAPEVVYGASMNIIDAPSIVLTASPVRLAEEGGARPVTVTAALGDSSDSVRPRAIPVALTWSGTAGSGDYAVVGERVTIPANARSGSATVTITPADDRLLEGDETIVLRGSTPGLLVEGTTLTLADDEEVPAVALAVSRDRISEDDGARTVTVSATLDPEVAMAHDVTTVDLELMGNATPGTDYTWAWSPSPPRISIPLNQTEGSNTVALTLTPRQDRIAEGDETIVVEGTAITESRSLVVKVATITLQDDDVRGVVVEPPRLVIDEGSSDAYTLRLTAQPTRDVNISVAVPADAPVTVTPVLLTFTQDNWAAAQTVTVAVRDDDDAVMHDDVELTHTVGGADYGGRVTAAPVTVTPRETTVPEVTIAAGAAEEGAGLVTFRVTLDVESSSEVRVSWATAGATATAGADYTESSGSVIFRPGAQQRIIVVPIADDELDEEDETFTVTLSAAQHADLGDDEATGTIRDDDAAPELVVSAPAAVATEGTDTGAAFRVTLSAASGRTVTVGYGTVDGTAAAPGDFTAPAANARLTFEPGDTEETITIPVIDDELDEDEETFEVRLAGAAGATVRTAAAAGRIADDDEPPAVGVADARAAEDAGPLGFVVTLSAASGRTVKVGYATADGTAKEPGDYAETAGTLTFAAGQTRRTVAVALVDDTLDETDETLRLTLSGPSNAGLAGGVTSLTATGTIADDDDPPAVGMAGARAPEDVGTLGFLVTLSAASSRAVTVAYATADDTAEAGEDYTATRGILTFAAGVTKRTIGVPVIDDEEDEEHEWEAFELTLTNPVNAVLDEDDSSGGGTMLTVAGWIGDDDDPAVAVKFGAAAYTATEGGTPATVTVRVDVDPEREVKIPLQAAHERGATAADYAGLPAEVVFAAGGALYRTFTLTAVDDAVDDGDERVVLDFGTLPAGVTGGDPDETTVTLADDEERGVAASVAVLSVDEAASTSYTVVLTSEPTADVTVQVTGTDGTDLTAPSEGLLLTFTAGDWDMAQTVTVTAADDPDVVADPVVELEHAVSGGDYEANAVTGPTVKVTIVENDTATVNVTDVTVAEDGGQAEFTVTLSEESSASVTLSYATSDGTAEQPDDYTAASGALTFTAPATALTVAVAVVDDTVDEAERETFELTLSDVAQAGFAGGGATLAATGTITDDDDPAVAVKFGAAAYTAAEGGGPVTVTVSLDKDPERELAIALSATHGSGAVAADYSGVPPEVRFTAGGTLSQMFAVTAVDDAVDEADETVTLGFQTLPARVTAGSPDEAVVTLTDDDMRGVTVSERELTIAEGDSGSYTVVLDSEPTAAVTVTIGGATDTPLTLAPPEQVLSFTAGDWEMKRTVRVTAAADADAVVPPAVTLTHAVAGGDYGSEAARSVTVRVTERTVPVLTLSPTAASVAESVGGSGQPLTVTLSVASSETVTVAYATADGTAAAGADYTAAAGTLSFAPAGSLTQTISVPILNDALDEDDETFTAKLSSPAKATLGSAAAAAVTITDDDALPKVSVQSGFLIADEDDGSIQVGVRLSAASGRGVEVSYATADLPATGNLLEATAGEDYGAVRGTLQFAAGTTERSFTVQITDDTLNEQVYEEFSVGLSDPVNAELGGFVNQVRINDDDDEPVLTLSPAPAATVAEGGVVTFTARLSAANGLPVNLRYVTTDGTAAAAEDYTGTGTGTESGTLRIAPGETSRTFQVSTTDDALDEDAETFMVRIRPSNAAFNAQLGSADRTTVTITDNDDPPGIGAADVAAWEDGGSLAFMVALDAASAKTVTVAYEVAAGTATAGDDYTAVPDATLTFAARTTTRTVSVALIDDEVHEPDETLTLKLSGPTNATVADAAATGTIREDEAVPLVALGLDPAAIEESGGISVVTASLSGTSSQRVTVTVTAAAGTGAVAGDFGQTGTTLMIEPGSTASVGTVRLTAVDNDVDSPDKTVTVTGTVTGGNGVAAPAARNLTIVDDEATPAVTLELSDDSISEDGGRSVVTAKLSGKSSQAVTVEVEAAAGTGAAAGDFTQSGTTLSIAAEAKTSSGLVTITAVDNSLESADKTVRVTGTATGGNGVATPAAKTLTIVDDEELTASVTAGAATVIEGRRASFPVTVTGGTSTAPVEVSYEVGGTATAGSDYTAPAERLTIGTGVASGTIAIATLDDAILDRGETLIVTLSAGSTATRAVAVAAPAADTEIVDQGTVTVAVASDGAVSEGSASKFTVTLSGAVAKPVAVGWRTADGTAVAGSDYTAVTGGALTVTAGARTGTLAVVTRQDTLAEADETFTVTVALRSPPAGVLPGTNKAEATISDDEELEVSVIAAAETVVESNPATFTVAVDGGTSTAPVEVTYTVGGTATAGSDYTAPSRRLTIGTGESSGTITIATLADAILDRDETLIVTLSGASTAKGSATVDGTAAQTEIEDQGMVTVAVASAGAVTEGSSSTFTVTLSGAVSKPVAVAVSTADGTAAAGDDYTAVSALALTVAATSTAKTFTVTTLTDTLAEGDETFTVTLSGADLPEGVTVGTATATATIEDDEELEASVSADEATVEEGDEATFEVAVTGGTSTAAVVVSYTVGGTATADEDYTAPPEELTLAAGDASGTITIATRTDAILDRDETLIVTLSGASTAKGSATVDDEGGDKAETKITDDGTVTVSVASHGAATEGSGAAFTVSLTGAVSKPVAVSVSTADGTADAGDDYTAVSAQALTVAAGSTTGSFTVATLTDTLAEGEETFTVTLSGSDLPAGVSVSTAPATGRITDDEELTASVTADAVTVVEGNAATFTVALTGGTSTAAVGVSYAVGGTATAVSDYTAPSGALTLAAGDTSGKLTIATRTDTVLDRGETLEVTLTGASTAKGSATVAGTEAERKAQTTIADSGTVTVSVSSGGAVTEGADSLFTVSLSGQVASAVKVTLSTSDGTAISGADYTAVTAQRLTFAANSTATQTLTVKTLADTLAEGEETFTVTLSGADLPGGVSVGTATASGRISDDEELEVSVSADATVVEGNAATFAVEVTGGTSTAPVAVTYTVGGTATAGSDYTAPGRRLTIGTGGASGTITIATLADAILDRDETLEVTLSGASTAKGSATVDGTAAQTEILDQGMETVAVASDGAVTEGASSTFTVTLSGAVSKPVAVAVSTADGTAAAGDDYTAVSAQALTVAATTTAKTFTVTTLTDTLAEGDETFTVTLSGADLPEGVTVGTATATATIEDDEELEASVSADEATVEEGDEATFEVEVTGGTSTAAVVVSYTVGGTATAGSDYTAPSEALTLAAEDAIGTITIATRTDAILDRDETLEVTLTGASTAKGSATVARTAEKTTAETKITDDGTVTVSVASDGAATEGSGAAFTVSLSGAVSKLVAVSVATADGTAAAGDDYTAVSAQALTVAAGSTTGSFTVATLTDTLAEGEETFTVTLSGSDLPAGVSVSTAPATGRITDDEELTASVTADAVTVVEGNAATFTVALTGGTSTAAVGVSYEVGGTATAVSDYTAPSGALTLAAGDTSGKLTIATRTDTVLDRGETLEVTLTGASTAKGSATVAGTEAERKAQTTIADTGAVTVSVSAGGAVTEGADALFTVSLSGQVASAVAVAWSTADGTATADADYTAVTAGSLSIAANSTTGSFTVATRGDTLAEADETFTVTLSGSGLPERVSVGTASASVTIEDDEELEASVSADAETVVEGNAATFTVEVEEGTSTAPVEVSYAVGGTATAGSDYTAPSEALTLAAGAANGKLTITTRTDTVLDTGETLIVTLTGASTAKGSATVDTTAAQTTIADSGTVTVSVASDGAVTEGSDSVFTVALSGQVASAVAVTVSTADGTADGTAAAGDDYTALSTLALTVAANSTTRSFTVATLTDTLAEGEETFTVTLSAPDRPAGVLVETAQATGRITDDDPLTVTVSAAAEAVGEGLAATFEVEVDGGTSTAPVEVTYTVGGTATADEDYTAPPKELTLAAGDASGTITIATRTDAVLDGDETLVVTLSEVSTAKGSASVNATPAETKITDDGTVTVSVTADGAATEGSGAAFTASLTGAVSKAVAVSVSTADGTADAGDDYTAVSALALTVAAGSTTASFTVATLTDTLAEGAEGEETFTVTLSGSDLPAGVSVSTAPATGRITDDDPLTVSVTAVAETVVEGNAAAFTVAVSGGTSTAPVEVTYRVDGTATADEDYTAPAGALTLAAGDERGTISVPTRTDTVADSGETLVVSLSEVSTAKGSVSVDATEAQTTIADAGTVTVSVASDGAATEGSAAKFTVTLSDQVASEVEVTWSTADGTATAGADYTAVTATMLTFAADSTAAQTLTVTTLPDTLAEGEESFTVTLSDSGLPDGVVLGTAQAIGRITDDDALTVSVAADAATVVEGNAATFTVKVAGATSTAAVAVTYEVGGTATPGSDYTAPAGTLTLAARSSSGSITIATLPDTVEDAGETLAVSLSGASTAKGTVTADSATAQITIAAPRTPIRDERDHGPVSTAVALTVAPAAVDEAAVDEAAQTTAAARQREVHSALTVVTVSLNASPRSVATVVRVAVGDADDSATEGTDYQTVSDLTVTIPARATSATGTFMLTPIDDALGEGDETATVTGTTDAPGVAVTGTELTIVDDETLSTVVALSVSPASVNEDAGGTAVTVTAALDEAARPDATVVTVAVGDAGDSATEGTDYQTVSDLTVTIPAGATSATGTFTLTPIDDALGEGDETATVTGTTDAPGLAVTGTELTIMDDETLSTVVTLSVSPASVNEDAGGTPVTVTAALDEAARPDATAVTVAIGDAGDSATEGTDYQTVSDLTVTIPAGATGAAGTFTLTPMDDALREGDETVSVTGTTDAAGLTVTGTELIIMDDDGHGRVLKAWIARFGRAVASQAVEAIGERLDGGGATHVTVGGVILTGRPAPEEDEAALGRVWTEEAEPARTMTVRELLTGSSALLSAGGESGSTARAQTAGAGTVTVWSSGAWGQFGGRDEAAELEIEGSVWSGLVGADYARAGLLAGLAVAYSESLEGSYRTEQTNGELHSWLVGGYPYLGYGMSDGLTLWAAGGYGQGVLTLSAAGDEPLETAQRLLLGAGGARGELLGHAVAPGAELAVKVDGLMLRSSTDAADGLPATTADVSRVRLALEGSYALRVGAGMALTPAVSVGVRHDGGDAETGFGLDASGALRWAASALGLSAQVSARGLVAHEARGLREWGLAGVLSWDPNPGSELGPSLTVTPSWGGAAASGVEALWAQTNLAGLAGAGGPQRGARMTAEAAYGLALSRQRGAITPYLVLGLAERGRDYRLGFRLRLHDDGQRETQLSAELTRREHSGGPTAEHEATFGVTLHL